MSSDELIAAKVRSQAQPVLDAFYKAVCDCDRQPPFKPSLKIASSRGPIRYDHAERAVVLVPYELLAPAAKAGMDRYATIGTLAFRVGRSMRRSSMDCSSPTSWGTGFRWWQNARWPDGRLSTEPTS